MKSAEEIQKLLSDPFNPCDIEWRVQASGLNNNPWVRVIPYVTNRAIQNRLDEAVGAFNWQNVFDKTDKGYLCGISILINDQWVTKWDGAEYSNIEPLKGALSGAMKRAAVQFGIGRYLYGLNEEFAKFRVVKNRYECEDGHYLKVFKDKRNKAGPSAEIEWFEPQLPDWALPSASFDQYITNIKRSDSLAALQVNFGEAYKAAQYLNRIDLRDKAVAAKDELKPILKQIEDEKQQKAKEKFESWVSNQIQENIISAENESVLQISYKRLKNELTGVCKAENRDTEHYLNVLEVALNEALMTMKGK